MRTFYRKVNANIMSYDRDFSPKVVVTRQEERHRGSAREAKLRRRLLSNIGRGNSHLSKTQRSLLGGCLCR